jgi:folate-dependent phosphoribosylglycinamide formyltransferase PurN
MKIVLLINKNNVSVEGVYRINEIYNTFYNVHDLIIVQSKKVSNENIYSKPLIKKIRSVFRKGILKSADTLLGSFLRASISRKTKKLFGNIEINDQIAYTRVNDNNINGKDMEIKLKEINPDLIIHISSDILKKNIFTIPKIGTLNLHHGVLPYIKGLDSVYWGVYYGKPKWVGATVHFIDEGIDTGSIIVKKECDYENLNTIQHIMTANEKIGTELIISAIRLLDPANNTQSLNFSRCNNYEESIYKSRATSTIVLLVLCKLFVKRFTRATKKILRVQD